MLLLVCDLFCHFMVLKYCGVINHEQEIKHHHISCMVKCVGEK